MTRLLSLVFACAVYATALATMAYLFLFIGNFGLARSLDSPARLDWPQALLVNIGIIVLFGLQHSLMARRGFKQFARRLIPTEAEPSVYVLLTCAALAVLFRFWQPLDFVIWEMQREWARGVLTGMFAFGWILVGIAIWLTNHFDLFGVRQAWAFFRGKRYQQPPFTTRGPYRFSRHPLYLGWLFAFWSAPTMTVGHLLFAGLMTAYLVVAIPYEEADLVRTFGKRYLQYRQRVPKFIPVLSNRHIRETFTVDSTGRYLHPEVEKEIKAPVTRHD